MGNAWMTDTCWPNQGAYMLSKTSAILIHGLPFNLVLLKEITSWF
jgi:hypothetical protein